MLRKLRKKKLVEGRKPRLRVSASVAEATGTKVDYLGERGQSAEYCFALINDLLVASGPSPRGDIDNLVFPHLPAGLDDRQKTNRVDYLLKKMREDGRIKSVRVDGKRMWSIA
jgi:ATP-dependent DNA helicase RecG